MHRIICSTLIAVLLGLALNAPAPADIPRLINYQGRLSASGTPLNGEYTVTFSLYSADQGGSAQWSETHEVQVTDGVFNVLLGSLAAFPNGLFSEQPELYLGIRVAGEAELTPRQRIASTPFSFQAERADAVRPGGVTTSALADGAVTSAKLAGGAAVTSLNGASGTVSVEGAGGIAVETSGNAITISGSGGGGSAGVQAIQNTDDALIVTNPIGPTVTLNVREGGVTAGMLADDAVTSASIADGSIEAADLSESAAVRTLNGLRGAVTIEGAGGATVTSAGSTITINAGSGGGGSGVQGVQNTDGFLQITNPNGPTVTIDVQDGAVSNEMIEDGAVTTGKLANLSVTNAILANNAVTSSKIQDGSVSGADLASDAAVRSLNSVTGAVTLAASGGATISRTGNTLTIDVSNAGGAGIQTLQSADGTLTITNPNGPTTRLAIADDAIDTDMISNAAVTSSKLAAGAVGTGHISAGAVTNTALANNSVSTTRIADGAVVSTKLADEAVTAAKLGPNAVTSAKIQDNTITSLDIQNGTIASEDLADNAAVKTINNRTGAVTVRGSGGTTVSTVGDTLVITSVGGVGGGVEGLQNTDGAISITNPTGPTATLSIATGGIVADMLASDAVTSSKIADGTITAADIGTGAVGSDEIADGSIAAVDLATNSVGSAQITDGSITVDDIGANAVGSAQIIDNSITAADIGTGAVGSDEIANGSITSSDLASNAAVLTLNGLTGGVGIVGTGGINVTTNNGLNRIEISSNPSSIRWKQDVEPLGEALDLVRQLRGVRYVWKESGEPDIGFIAEEVGQVIPEIVQYESNGVDARTVDYARVVSVLVEAMKEQQEQIEAQQETLDRLEERLARLEAAGATASVNGASN